MEVTGIKATGTDKWKQWLDNSKNDGDTLTHAKLVTRIRNRLGIQQLKVPLAGISNG